MIRYPRLYPVAALAATGLLLAGCVAGRDARPPVATPVTPVVSESGNAVLDRIEDCGPVAALLGEVVEGRALRLNSVSEAGVFCEWSDGTALIDVQVDVEAPADVPDAGAVERAGAVIVTPEAVGTAGGVAFTRTDPLSNLTTLSVLLPELSVRVNLSGVEPTEDELARLVESMIPLAGLDVPD